jgi:unsaturated rhamnogalacturonyl hydrolase
MSPARDASRHADRVALARAASARALAYPYRVWGFGEDIALRALLEVRELTGDARPAAFVHDLVVGWARRRPRLVPADHVAPGMSLLQLHAAHGDYRLLATALDLAHLLAGFPRVDGVAVHRWDLDALRDTIWVDCMALDAPFLTALGRATGDDAWTAFGVDQLVAYARVLRDPDTGLFHHGYDVATRRRSACRWARGNGWALHGLVDTLEALPSTHPARAEVAGLTHGLLGALAPRQDASGLWRTVLDDPTTTLENSTATVFASAGLKARRLGLVAPELQDAVDAMNARAVTALAARVDADGSLRVSTATPVGDRATYAKRDLGVFPWGQGPLLLTLLELHRASAPEAPA